MVKNPNCKFEKSPVAFLKGIYKGVCNDAQDIFLSDGRGTHAGRRAAEARGL